MPVPTQTYRSSRWLNPIFAASAVLLLIGTLLIVGEEQLQSWRSYQRESMVWEAAILRDPTNALTEAEQSDKARLEQQLSDLDAELANNATLNELQQTVADLTYRQNKLSLPLAREKGKIGPLQQQIETARLAGNDARVKAKTAELADIMSLYDTLNSEMAQINTDLTTANEAIRNELDRRAQLQRSRDDIQRKQDSLNDKIAAADPQGEAAVGQFLRNRVFLVNWANPNEQVQQVVVPDVRTDLNFVTVETVDRCATCHFNIDKPDFERNSIVRFVERQLARFGQQDLSEIEQPVVHLNFWLAAAQEMDGEATHALDALLGETLTRFNQQRTAAGLTPVADKATLVSELTTTATSFNGTEEMSRPAMYATASRLMTDLRALVKKQAGNASYDQLFERYRVSLVEELNEHRAKAGQKKLDTSPVLLAHPKLDTYVDADSFHPIKSMGCTSCHEGSGQETIFEHTAHSPREMWVDAANGSPVPDFLIKDSGSRGDMKKLLDTHLRPAPKATSEKVADSKNHDSGGAGSEGKADGHAESGSSHNAHVYTHRDVNLLSPTDPGALAPDPGTTMTAAGNSAAFVDPAHNGATRLAVRQADYWGKKYGWHAVHYMHWEKPMHSLEFIESSCNKCHTEIFDIKDAAPTLFEGRQLFASLGCVNCHSVDSLKDDPDVFVDPEGVNPHIRKVGPSLAHVDQKLSAQMIANWIWSPKAFRPTSRMPHFFMLENNSAPVDILRTRTEVTAMTYALMKLPSAAEQRVRTLMAEKRDLEAEKEAGPSAERLNVIEARLPALPREILEARRAVDTYVPEPLPEDIGEGDVANGRAIFNAVGCLACHTNMAEHGAKWIVDDLVKRKLLGEDEAKAEYDRMSYNQQQTYAKLYLDDKFVNVGPELSGVGTKLLAYRTPEQAKGWLYDWLRNPTHYSSDTIMPSFRLEPGEANDLAAYLLTLERPTGDASNASSDEYVVESFGFDDAGRVALDDDSKAMLRLITANLLAAQITPEMALKQIDDGSSDKWSTTRQLEFVGQKMISHYGCNGCHTIDGFESATSACANLDDWGMKDPHKLDFGYFDHAYDAAREHPYEVHKVKHEGLGADATQITADDADAIRKLAVSWEHMDLERRPWLYNKLHNTRVYDRGRSQLEGSLEKFRQSPSDMTGLGRPYDKLKMPKFFLKDEQIRSIVTYVTSIRKPLVTETMQKATYTPDKMLETRGRQVATVYNCYGCHNIEGNHVHIQEFYDVFNEDGSFNYTNLNNAPPRLVGQGSKTQPSWLHHFVSDVQPLRPWLKVRMPSFPLTEEQATDIVDYFAGNSRTMAKDLAGDLATVQAYIKSNSDSPWFDARATSLDRNLSRLAHPLANLREFAIDRDLVAVRDIDPQQTTEAERRAKYEEMVRKVSFLSDLNDVQYPFPKTPMPNLTDERFARGYKLFTSMGCNTCHALGETDALYQLWEMDQQAMGGSMGDDEAFEEDPYGSDDDDAGYGEEEDDGYGGYGDDDDGGATATAAVPDFLQVKPGPVVSAPNLSFAHRRIQWNWLYNWLQEPNTIQPGTAMPQWFPGSVTSPQRHPLSAFHAYPPEVKGQMEQMYGYTGEEQIELLMDFVYAAGARNFTPGIERLTGAKTEEIVLKPIEKPEPDELAELIEETQGSMTDGSDGAETGGAATGGGEPAAVKAAAIERQDEEVKAFEGTRVVGRILLGGRKPPKRPLKMTGAECLSAHDGPVIDPVLLVSGDGGIANAMVYVKNLPAGVTGKPTNPNPYLTQEGCLYIPRVLGMVAGQDLKIHNGDNMLHNVNMQSQNNGKHNFGQPVKGMVNTVAMKNTEMAVPLKCDVHPWMAAYVHVMDHPFFGVTDDEGWFEITGLPAGTYDVEIWHEDRRVPSTTFKITVGDGESRRVADVTVGG